MKENLKKARAAAATAAQAAKESEGSTDSTSLVEGEVIIKVKEEPKLIETMKQVRPTTDELFNGKSLLRYALVNISNLLLQRIIFICTFHWINTLHA